MKKRTAHQLFADSLAGTKLRKIVQERVDQATGIPRNIKPGNVLLKGGITTVSDFGLFYE